MKFSSDRQRRAMFWRMNRFSADGDSAMVVKTPKGMVFDLTKEEDRDAWHKWLEEPSEEVKETKSRYDYTLPSGDITREVLIDGVISSLKKNGFTGDDLVSLKSAIDTMDYSSLRDNYNALLFEQHPSHYSSLVFFDQKLPEPRLTLDEVSYTHKELRESAEDMVADEFKNKYKSEELLTVVPIERTHNKVVKVVDNPKYWEPEKYHYHKVAVLSAVKNQGSPSGVTYVIRKGRAQGGVGFIESNETPFMTFNVDDAYSKLNEMNYYPKESDAIQPTMKDWSVGGKEWVPDMTKSPIKRKLGDWSDGDGDL